MNSSNSSLVDSLIMKMIGCKAAANTSGDCSSHSIDGKMCWPHSFCVFPGGRATGGGGGECVVVWYVCV